MDKLKIGQIVELSKTMHPNDVAKMFGVSPSLVRYYAKGGKDGKYRKKLAKEDEYPGLEKMVGYIDYPTKEDSIEAISKEFKITKPLARKWLRRTYEKYIIFHQEDDFELGIRKLTPRECFALMDFNSGAYERASKVNSPNQLYKQAGNAIVKNCLVAIIGQLYPGCENKYKEVKIPTYYYDEDELPSIDKNFDYIQYALPDGKYRIDKNVALIELFGGIGTQAMAFETLKVPFTHHLLVEFDKFPVASYNAIHGTNFKPISVCDVHIDDLKINDKENNHYFLTYSFPCFVKGTLVNTKEGLIPIEQVKIGDMVVTHDGSYQKVTDSKCTGEKEIWEVNSFMGGKTFCTSNHLFYARKKNFVWNNKIRRYERTFTPPEYISCEKLDRECYLGFPINKESKLPDWKGISIKWNGKKRVDVKNQISNLLDKEEFWWLIGRYVADGWYRNQGGIVIACSKEEVEEFKSKANACNINISISSERTTEKVHIALKEWESFVEPFGRGAFNKVIPGFVLDLPVPLLKSFLLGYESGDGYYVGNKVRTSSISHSLTMGISQIVAKVYHRPSSIYYVKRKEKCTIEGRIVNQKSSWELCYKKENSKQDKAFYEDGYIWYPVKSVQSTGKIEEVFDITVENNHSFVANNSIVHNCTDLSIAGKMEGMSRKDWEEGNSTRSGLLWEVERILREGYEKGVGEGNPSKYLPDTLLMENVTGVHSKKNEEDWNYWLEFLSSIGYKSMYKDMNAKDYGIPQNRNRTFCISYLEVDKDYEFPKEIELKTCLEDYLEDEDKIDEKYYINTLSSNELIAELQETYGDNIEKELFE